MAVGDRESYVIVNHVIEFSLRGGPWRTWTDPGLQDAMSAADDDALIARFTGFLKIRHDPATGIRFRLVHRTAVIEDIVVAEEMADGRVAVPREPGEGEFTTPHAIHGEETAPCGHPGRNGYCNTAGCWCERNDTGA